MRWWPVSVATLLSLLVITRVSVVLAQTYEDQVEQLNRDAMEAYNQLDINTAGQLLEQALRTAQEGGLSGRIVAVTNLNLGMVYIGGLGDQQGGLSYFLAAICSDPAVELDPLVSTPDMQLVYGQAQLQAQQGACGAGAPPQQQMTAPAYGQQPVAPGMQVGAQGGLQPLVHIPPTEQRTQTPLPLYVEVSPSLGAVGVNLYYRGLGMNTFKRVQMYSFGQGMAYQISCNDVFEPSVSYYIEVVGGGGQMLAALGSAAAPINVVVTSTPTQAPAALPGRPSPTSCVTGECPPGVKCEQSGTAAIGDACEKHTDCQSGLICGDGDTCLLDGAGGTEVGSGDEWEEASGGDSGDMAPFFVQVGLVFGFAYADSGKPADRLPPLGQIYVDDRTAPEPGSPEANFVADPLFVDPDAIGDPELLQHLRLPAPDAESFSARLTPWEPDADSGDARFLEYPGDCEADGILTTPTVPGPTGMPENRRPGDPNRLPSSYCVRVKSPGFVLNPALRFNIGYFVTERLAPSIMVRVQFGAGQGTLAGLLIGGRLEYLFVGPATEGFMLSGFAGLAFGQIQVQPGWNGPILQGEAPYIQSGIVDLNAGLTFRYRFNRYLGIIVAPEGNFLFPNTLFDIDVTLGPELAF